MWRPNIPVQILGFNQNMLFMFVYPDLPCQAFVLSLIYGPSRFHQKRDFWNSMTTFADSITELWLLLGDFNSVNFQSDKRSGAPFASSSSMGLHLFVTTNYGLVDLGFNSNPFTWNNGRLGAANIRERLDRGIGNQAWRVFPNASIIHAPASASDHLPLILNTNGHSNIHRRPFRFESMWVRDPGSFFPVANACAMHVAGGPACIFSQKLDHIKIALRKWNRLHFGFIKHCLQHLSRELDEVQCAAPTLVNRELEASIKNAIHEQLLREQILWCQRSRVEWLVSKDLNTKFYHLSRGIRRNQNSLITIQSFGNNWV